MFPSWHHSTALDTRDGFRTFLAFRALGVGSEPASQPAQLITEKRKSLSENDRLSPSPSPSPSSHPTFWRPWIEGSRGGTKGTKLTLMWMWMTTISVLFIAGLTTTTTTSILHSSTNKKKLTYLLRSALLVCCFHSWGGPA